MVTRHDSAHMVRALLRASHLATFEQLPALMTRHAAEIGLRHVRIYVADLQEEVLREVTGEGPDAGRGGQELRIDATLAGRAFQTMRVQTASVDGSREYWLPILDGTERLGVLRVDFDAGPDSDRGPTVEGGGPDAGSAAVERGTDTGGRLIGEFPLAGPPGAEYEEAMRDLASLMGMLLVSKRTNSDSFARLTRVNPMSVSAEMQWTLMPPRTFANDRVTIAAAMEPAYETAGDAFDYALAGDIAHLAVFDAMGHDTAAGLTANLAMATSRNRRRHGAAITEARESIESMLLEQFARDRYTTGILADLELHTGLLTWVNCGHPPPVLIRGGRWNTNLKCPPTHPMGTDLGLPVVVGREQLEPGDRLLLYTDGITEARDADGNEFGRDRFVDFIIRHESDGLPVPETLRRLVRAVLDHHDGKLNDDATVLLCEWHGGAHRAADVE